MVSSNVKTAVLQHTITINLSIHDQVTLYLTKNPYCWDLTCQEDRRFSIEFLISLCEYIFSNVIPEEGDIRIHINGFVNPIYIYRSKDLTSQFLAEVCLGVSDKSN